jgi:predicted phosphodiesterase
VYRMGYSLDTWLSRPRNGPRMDSFQRWAVSLARQRRADVVVTGHTHVPQQQAHQGLIYLNSGSCSRGTISYLAMDTRNERYAAVAA